MSDLYELMAKVARTAERLPRPAQSDIIDLDGFRFHAYNQFTSDGERYLTWVLAAPAGWSTGVEFGRWNP